jgi:UPF0716 family protein affecting phage T7 exclusion
LRYDASRLQLTTDHRPPTTVSPFYLYTGLASLVMFVVGLAATGYVLLRLPGDFFTNALSPSPKRRFKHPALHYTWLVVRNVLGAGLVIGGVVMLVTPGQGLLTLVVGLMLVDFPGKRRLSLKLIRSWRLIEAANNWRLRYGKPLFEIPAAENDEGGSSNDERMTKPE